MRICAASVLFYVLAFILAFLVILLGSKEALAAPNQVFDPEMENMLRLTFIEFVSQAEAMESKLIPAASRLFWGLCVIGLVLKGAELIFKEDGGIQQFFGSLVHMMIIIGIFEFLLSNGSQIGAAVIESLMRLPADGDPVTPIDLLNTSMQICSQLSEGRGRGIADEVIFLLIQVFIAVLLFLAIINYAILYLSAYIMCVAGIVVLGFGAFVYTRDLAVNYLKLLLSLGLQLMVMILVCTTGMKTVQQLFEWLQNNRSYLSFMEMLLLLFITMLFYAMTKALPALAGSLVTGSMGSNYEGRAGFNQAFHIAMVPVMTAITQISRRIKA